MALRVTILGCGGSSGVPLIGDIWGNCDPNNPKNRRRRSSILLDQDGTQVLIDTGPDLREQLLSAGINHLDAVVYSHSHADHAHGIDELRAVNWLMRRSIDCYADAATLADLHQRFGYALVPIPDGGHFPRPALRPIEIRPGESFQVGPQDRPMSIEPFLQDHGYSTTLGFRVGRFAYSTDVIRFDEAALAALEDLDVWVVDCVRTDPPHAVHAHLPMTLDWIAKVRPRRAVLTHMNQTMDYDTLCRILPEGVEPAYDGMVLSI